MLKSISDLNTSSQAEFSTVFGILLAYVIPFPYAVTRTPAFVDMALGTLLWAFHAYRGLDQMASKGPS